VPSSIFTKKIVNSTLCQKISSAFHNDAMMRFTPRGFQWFFLKMQIVSNRVNFLLDFITRNTLD